MLKSVVSSLKISYGEITLELDIEPELGFADSVDLEIDLPKLFVAVGEAAADRNCAVAVLVDEIQYLSLRELGALIMTMNKLQQKQLPVVLIAAGLSVLPGLS